MMASDATGVNVLREPGIGETWSVLCTFSRREKRVALACEKLALRYYLPLHSGGLSTKTGLRLLVPLFPGYVFACMDAGARRSLLRTGGIVRVIPVPRPERLLTELHQIQGALESGADLTPTAALRRGRWVRVIEGPLVGVTGVVADRRARRGGVRLVLNVTLLGRGATVEIDPEDVELVPAPRDDSAGGVRLSARGAWGWSLSRRAREQSPAELA